jgi:tight adherence protein B
LAGTAARAERMGDGLLRHRGKRLALGDALDAAGLAIRPGELIVVVAVSSVVALIGGWMIASLVVGVAMAALALLGAKAALGHLARRRRRQFTDQLPGTLQMLAGALRAGHGLAQSIDTVARESESPTSDEFRRLTVETRLGRDLSETLWALAARVRSTDFEWVVQAVDIHRDVGGDLAEILDSVAGTIRDRNRVRRQVSALTAEGRLSGWVLMAIPFAVAAMMAVTNPRYLNVLFSTRNGLVLLGVGAVLMTVGGGWLRRIAKPVF